MIPVQGKEFSHFVIRKASRKRVQALLAAASKAL
jgi:hypothetical protein